MTGVADSLAAEDAEDLHAAHARKHDVEQDEVEPVAARCLERGLAIGGAGDLIALASQVEGQRLPKGRVVLDDEQAPAHVAP